MILWNWNHRHWLFSHSWGGNLPSVSVFLHPLGLGGWAEPCREIPAVSLTLSQKAINPGLSLPSTIAMATWVVSKQWVAVGGCEPEPRCVVTDAARWVEETEVCAAWSSSAWCVFLCACLSVRLSEFEAGCSLSDNWAESMFFFSPCCSRQLFFSPWNKFCHHQKWEWERIQMIL